MVGFDAPCVTFLKGKIDWNLDFFLNLSRVITAGWTVVSVFKHMRYLNYDFRRLRKKENQWKTLRSR